MNSFVTDDLRALVQAQLDATYEGDDYFIRPDPQDVIVDAMVMARSDIRDAAADLADCNKPDDCTARAVVLRRFADWMEEQL